MNTEKHSIEDAPKKLPAWFEWTAFLLLFGVILFLRLDRLEVPSLGTDEYLHFYAAQGLNESGEPQLPSLNSYSRAIFYTKCVALSFKQYGVNEWAARFPSVLFDSLALLILYFFARRQAGSLSALIVLGLVGASPWWLEASKNCRMYTLFHASYLFAAWMIWEFFNRIQNRLPSRANEAESTTAPFQLKELLSIRYLWPLPIFACSLLLALKSHPLAGSLLAVLALYVVLVCISRFHSFFGILLAVGVLGAAAASLSPLGKQILEAVGNSPSWNISDPYYYWKKLFASYPIFLISLPLVFFCLVKRSYYWGIFSISLFITPLLLKTFLFSQHQVRYMWYMLPFIMFPIACLAGVYLSAAFHKRKWIQVASILVFLAAGLLHSAPKTRAWLSLYPSPPWKECYQWLESKELGDDCAIITTYPLATLYYGKRKADYIINNVWIKDSGFIAKQREDGKYLDGFAGIEMITDLAELKVAVEKHPKGFILVDRHRLNDSNSNAITAECQEYIRTQLKLEEWPQTRQTYNPALVYSWER